MQPLLSPINISEGRDQSKLDAIKSAFKTANSHVVDLHHDADHHRSVFTLAGGQLTDSVIAGVETAVAQINLQEERGVHPHVGVVDIVPVVYPTEEQHGTACAQALVLAHEIGKLGIPVFLYGELAAGRTRAELRKGGPRGLAERMQNNEVQPDFGPKEFSPRVGATLVGARQPLVAVNFELAAGTAFLLASEIASKLRLTSKTGLPGVRALAFTLQHRFGINQISCNVEDPKQVSAQRIVDFISQFCEVKVVELVGLVPAVFLTNWQHSMPIQNLKTIESVLSKVTTYGSTKET